MRRPARRRPGRSRARPVEVRGGPLERHLARTVGGGDEDDVGIAAGDLVQGEAVDLEGAARRSRRRARARSAGGDLGERGELARLAAAAHDLDSPPGPRPPWRPSVGSRRRSRRRAPISGNCAPRARVRRGRGARRRSRRRRRSAATLGAAAARRGGQRQRGHRRATRTPTAHATSPDSALRGIDLAAAPADVDDRHDRWLARRSATRSRRSRRPPTRAGVGGDAAAPRPTRIAAAPVGARLDRHDHVVQPVGDPGRPVRHHHRARREAQAIVAWSVPRRGSSRQTPQSSASPAPTASRRRLRARGTGHASSTRSRGWKSRNIWCSLRSRCPSVLRRSTNGQPAAHTTPSPDASAHASCSTLSMRSPVAAS